MANTYSMFYPTHENGPASYIRRNNAFCFSMTVSLSLLDRQENGFIPGPDKNPTCPESPACTAKDALSRHRGIHRHSSNASRILTNLRITIPTKSIHSWNVVREHSTGISINDLFHWKFLGSLRVTVVIHAIFAEIIGVTISWPVGREEYRWYIRNYHIYLFSNASTMQLRNKACVLTHGELDSSLVMYSCWDLPSA